MENTTKNVKLQNAPASFMDNNLGPVLGVVFAILGGLVLFFKNKADNLKADNVLSETKIKDASLLQQELQAKAKLKGIDKDIQNLKDERVKLQNQNLTDQERADKWNTPKDS